MAGSLARYLADTSVFSHLNSQAVADIVEPLLERDLVAVCGMVELESLFSARNLDELQEKRASLGTQLPRVETEERDFERAAEVMEALAAAGKHRAAKVTDLVIAAVAERTGLTLLHYDRDFDHIGEVTGQTVEWVVAKGSA